MKLSSSGVACHGPTKEDTLAQANNAREMRSAAVCIAQFVSPSDGIAGYLPRKLLAELTGLDAVALWSDISDLREARIALPDRNGPILALTATGDMHELCVL